MSAALRAASTTPVRANSPPLAAFWRDVLCSKSEHRSAFLKEWGRVKVSLQVVAWMRVSAGAARDVDVEVCGLWLFRTRVRRSDEGRLGCRAFLR
jgi:hypothetical protein